MPLTSLAGSHWQGTAELWLDPMGNDAQTSQCSFEVDVSEVRYTWEYEGAPQNGSITLDASGGAFRDSWHNPAPMTCARVAASTALVNLLGSYAAGDGPRWGWRLILSLRPSWEGAPEALVLQMTNITPWGEEARAVRMVSSRQ